jgi:hypothetical protein
VSTNSEVVTAKARCERIQSVAAANPNRAVVPTQGARLALPVQAGNQ